MRVYRDTLQDRRVCFERNEETGNLNEYELTENDEKRWQLAHITDEELDDRFDEDRYISVDD